MYIYLQKTITISHIFFPNSQHYIYIHFFYFYLYVYMFFSDRVTNHDTRRRFDKLDCYQDSTHEVRRIGPQNPIGDENVVIHAMICVWICIFVCVRA